MAVLTQYQPRSLNEHIGVGRPWDLDRTTGGVRLLQPYQSSRGERGAWQEGTADAIRFNLDVARESVSDVLILAGDHIYKMDYRPMLRFHPDRNADVTLAVRTVPGFEAHRYGMMATDPDGRVVSFEEKPRRTTSTLASMGIYIFRREVLADWLAGPGKRHRDLGRDVIPAIIESRQRLCLSLPELLGRYRHDPGVLRSQHGAAGRDARVGSVRPELDHPYPQRGAPGSVDGGYCVGRGQPLVRRLPHRGHGDPLDHLGPGSTWRPGPWCAIPS